MIIIVEGPDGSGKTSLVRALNKMLGTTPHNREHATSTGGPRSDLYSWMAQDIKSWPTIKETRIYDRHPVVSEYIYGPIVRGEIAEEFETLQASLLQLYAHLTALIVVCLPPLAVVKHNIQSDPAQQMPGVVENIDRLWLGYQDFLYANPRALSYDYTQWESDHGQR